jgi:nucleoside-diphosphate-sugar epimerase
MLTREKVAMLRHHWVCDSKDARTALGWQPSVTFRDGLKLTAKWYEENGWLQKRLK